MPDYQACVLHVLGKENLPAAKQNLKEYLAIIEMAQNATRNIKSSITKRVKAEVEKEWTGDGKLYVWSEEKDSVVLDNDFAECMLMDDSYMTNGQAEADPVESSSYRKILYETFPLSKLERQFLDPAVLPYDQISHLTAHQISFADCKVQSLMKGEQNLPQQGEPAESVRQHYQRRVDFFESTSFHSLYIQINNQTFN
ncbi:TPA: hypothetical protein ACH3X1_016540 [Trebouxia sp. C0004]